MKIKTNHTKRINFGFGIAVITLGLLFGLSFSKKMNSISAVHNNNNINDEVNTTEFQSLQEFEPEWLELQINQQNFIKIKQKRAEALKTGLLRSSRSDLVPGDMRIKDDLFSIAVRLKGDLLDHLRGEKWSYRIELKNEKTWKEMSEFSIHNSKARSHIAEWFMHQLFTREGIITPLYDFIQLKENGDIKGVYAYEEHFTDELLLRNKRQIAPILKHNDDAYWDNVQREVKPFYWTKALEIDLFNTNNSSDSDFMKSFEYAKSVLQRFIDGDIKATEVFDVDKMAKYYALMELSHAFHAQQITNIRFYLDPLTGYLEPIAFDCFGEKLPEVTDKWEAAGEGVNSKSIPREGYPYGGVYMHLLFQDESFFKKYMFYLEQFTQTEYLEKLKLNLAKSVEDRELLIRSDKEYANYSFSFEEVFKKASYTRKKILPLPNYSLKVFTNSQSRRRLILTSFHFFPLEIIGFGNELKLTDPLETPLILEAFHKESNQFEYSLINPKEKEFIYYRTLGIDSTYQYQIKKNDFPDADVKPIDTNLSYWINNKVISSSNDTLRFIEQISTLSDYLIIPEGYIMLIQPGQEINFKDEASIISDSPILAEGTSIKEIRFIGEDRPNQAIISNSKSIFNHCDFINLSSIQYKGINSKAGISLKDSVSISNSIFSNSNNNYSISLMNSTFKIDNVDFSNCLGNGIEFSYSKGVVIGINLSDVVGNGLVIDNSHIEFHKANFNNIDGISILASNSMDLQFDSITITNSFQGIVSQNNTNIRCDKVLFKNIQNGLIVQSPAAKHSDFQGNALIFENVEKEIIRDLYSSVIVNGKSVSH